MKDSALGMEVAAVPLVDLRWQHEVICAEIWEALLDVMARGAFVRGPEVGLFETEFAEFSGVAHCVGVGNGTDALELALRASGVEPGASVIVPANTFVASAEAVVRAGARPVLVDCDRYGLIDPIAVSAALDTDTRAVMPVHLFGQIADMESLTGMLAGRPVRIIEDAAQAHGASRNGLGIGSWGTAAGTSFYPGKNLGAYGDGGAVLTGDADVAARVRQLADHGSDRKYVHSEIGCNSRLDTLQAVVLRAKLRRLADWNGMRRRAADLYGTKLEPLARAGLVRLPEVVPGNVPVWHLYVVQVDRRDEVLGRMQADGMGVGIHYPIPVHLTEAFRHLGYGTGDFPVAEAMARRILSLPIYPGITEEIIDRVVASLTAAVAAYG